VLFSTITCNLYGLRYTPRWSRLIVTGWYPDQVQHPKNMPHTPIGRLSAQGGCNGPPHRPIGSRTVLIHRLPIWGTCIVGAEIKAVPAAQALYFRTAPAPPHMFMFPETRRKLHTQTPCSNYKRRQRVPLEFGVHCCKRS
jgi:hypothetical protein